MTQSYVGTKQVLAWAQEKDGRPGYAVKYEDGFVSWSPADVFEAAYLAIGHVDHLPAHQRRVIAEQVDLENKVNKLEAFLENPLFDGLPECEQKRLVLQLDAMKVYLSVIAMRVKDFK